MLEKIPHGLGHALRGVRAGFDKIASEDPAFADIPDTIALSSVAFEDGGAIPARHTADGEGLSPPLAWRVSPPGAGAVALLVEDPDAPTPEPLVHLLAWDLPPDLAGLPEGQFRGPGHDGLDENLGRNSFLRAGWLPPDPPTGHGPHLYVFQLFALDRPLAFDHHPSRGAFLDAIKGRVLARGMLVGTYERP
ncbi:YbhB/YbcL family Raf kinase inhibitor-like protein [uncultured Caulobacter sp.]|uniref:YbhB/YbcL family Raf kinase inhibitor-like protein n=1 Tax=uncultured Caulobacter sp. TaxID=158749 RepID=UPI00262E052E|nr:YbhB/YbcL family Raf kinase inhibitor-like protein [uncultured Caulobacter sp.]